MKKIIASVIALAALLSFAACGGKGKSIDIEGYNKNRKVTFISKGDDGSSLAMTEYVCDEGRALVSSEGVIYLKRGEDGGGKAYLLTPADKTGFSLPLENLSDVPALFENSFEPYRALGAKKTGRGKIAGYAADIFLLEYEGVRIKFWVAEKSDITLKRATVNEAGEEVPDADDEVFADLDVPPYNFEVTEIIVGGVTPADIVNLEDYTILSAGDLMGGLYGDPFGAAFYEAFGNSFGGAFGEAYGSAFGEAYGDALGGMLGGAFGALDRIGNRIDKALGRIFR